LMTGTPMTALAVDQMHISIFLLFYALLNKDKHQRYDAATRERLRGCSQRDQESTAVENQRRKTCTYNFQTRL
jgi:hypothetical protein